MTVKVEWELLDDMCQHEHVGYYVHVQDYEFHDDGIIGQGKTEAVAYRNAIRNCKKLIKEFEAKL